jgi:hypothetical protein
MTKKAGKKAPGAIDKLFVVGLDNKGKPRGARFAETNDLTISAALDLMLTAVIAPSPAFAELGMKLPQGRLYASGKAFIPNIKRSLHDELFAILSRPGDTSQAHKLAHPPGQTPADPPATSSVSCVSPTTSGLPRSWETIGVGHMVLSHESPLDGWWESIVEHRDGDILTLRFRDYPKQPTFIRHVLTVALVNPGPLQDGQQ